MSQSLNILFILFLSLFLLLFFTLFIYFLYKLYKYNQYKEKHIKIEEDLSIFKVQVPESNELEIKVAEQMYTTLLGIKDHALSFEIVGDYTGISFYVTAPKKLESILERSIHASYPEAQLTLIKEKDFKLSKHIDFENSKSTYKEFYLKKEDHLPLRFYDEIEIDPLNTLTAVMSKMKEKEAVLFQLLIKPTGTGWKEKGNSKANSLSNKKDKDGNIKTDDKDREKIELIKKKTKKEGFVSILRILCLSEDSEISELNMRNLENAISTFSDPNGNSFSEKKVKNKNYVTTYFSRLFPYFHVYLPFFDKEIHKGYSILNTSELATIFHFPNHKVKTPGISWLRSKTSFTPINLPKNGEGIYLGKSDFRGVERKVYMKDADRRRHFYVIGQTGSGKTELAKFMCIQDIMRGSGVCYMDPHGAAIDDILKIIPEDRMDDVILFRPGDDDYSVGFNILEASSEREKNVIVNSFIQLLKKMYDPNDQGIVGPQLERTVRNCMLTAMVDPNSTLIDTYRLIIDSKFQKEMSQKVTDPLVKKYWTDEIANTSSFHKSEKMGYFTSKFDRFVTEEIIRNVIGQSKSAFNFREVMDNKKILLVDLNKGKIGEENAKFLGLLIVPKLLSAAFSRQDTPQELLNDFYLYVDEFQNFATDDFITILSEARKYRLNLIMINQFLDQMSEGIRKAIFGNVGTFSSFRIGEDDAPKISEKLNKKFTESDLTNLNIGNLLIKLLVDGQPSEPFSLKVDWPLRMKWMENGSEERAKKIVEISRKKYAKPSKELEKELSEKLKPKEDPNAKKSPFGSPFGSKRSPFSSPFSKPFPNKKSPFAKKDNSFSSLKNSKTNKPDNILHSKVKEKKSDDTKFTLGDL